MYIVLIQEPNYMLTWEESRRKCEEYNSTLILSPANLRIPIDVNHHYWLGYYRNENVIWNKGTSENIVQANLKFNTKLTN